MGTADYSAEPQQDRQQGRVIVESDEELQTFITKPDARLKSMSNMDSLPLTTTRSGEQPQEPASGVATTARKRGRPKKQAGLAQPVHLDSRNDSPIDIPASAKRRGRPRKYVSLEMTGATTGSAADEREDASYVDPAEQRQVPAKTLGRPKKRITDEMATTGSGDEADAGYFPTPKELKARTKTPARPKKRVTYEMTEFNAASEEKEDGAAPQKEGGGPKSYERPIARYVAPPEQGKPPSIRTIYFAFQAEKDVGEEDPFSVYAFGGPRHREPFRMLQDIGDPNEKDIMGWAENLRWAHEQWKFFPDAVGNTGWNESPEQMEKIAEIREQQFWLSDELVAHLSKPKKRSKKKAWSDAVEG